MKTALPLLLLACSRPNPSAEVCQTGWGSTYGTDALRMVYVDDPALDGGGPLVMQIVVPIVGARHPDGAPVVVHLPGTWEPDQAPLGGGSVHLGFGHGIIAIYPNLPGGTGPQSTAGVDDRRGPLARQAVGVALRYAAGELADVEGCTLADRAPEGLGPRIALSGMSNGGNLVWTTLGDAAVALPADADLVGVVTFETPASGQFANVDQGPADPPSPGYTRGACGLSPRNGLTCAWDYSAIAYDPSGDKGGVVFLDSDGDAHPDEDEPRLGAVRVPASAAYVQSLEATAALFDKGILPENRLPPDKAGLFWLDREGPPAMPGAVARLPALAGISVGTAVDHVATGLVDHEHVTGMVAAMQAAGLPWTRLHPDAAYVEAVAQVAGDAADLPANTPVLPNEADPTMEPDEDGDHPTGLWITASALELLDRAAAGDWSSNLDAVLHPNEK